MARRREYDSAAARVAARRERLRIGGGGEIKIGLDAPDMALLHGLASRDDVSVAEAVRRAIRAAAAQISN